MSLVQALVYVIMTWPTI